MDSGDLELVNRIVREMADGINRRLDALESLAGLNPWESAAGRLDSIEARLTQLEAVPPVPAVVVDEPPPVVAETAAEEIIADAVVAAEEIVEDAVEAAAEIVADAVETVADSDDEPPPPNVDPTPDGDEPAIVEEILGDNASDNPAPQRGSWWHREILRR